jgi:DNA repair exonuclease SbcCD ATPase subunit
MIIIETQEIKSLINQNLAQEIERLKKELEKAENKNEELENKIESERIKYETRYEKLQNEAKQERTKYETRYEKYETKYENLLSQAKEERKEAKEERERLLKNYFLKGIIIMLFVLLLSCQYGFNEYIYYLLNDVNEVVDNFWQKLGDFFTPFLGYFINHFMDNNNNIQMIN